jgi:hypothetical protein
MRPLILAAVLATLAPLAYAQPAPGTTGRMAPPAGAGTMGGMGGGTMGGMHGAGPGGTMSGGPMQRQPDPTNCGTPDEPKPCGRMPRRALNQYPANKQ